MSNVEQGISNDEVKLLQLFPSAFFIRYSTCPLCPQENLSQIRHAYECWGTLTLRSRLQGRRVFCGSLLNPFAACAEVEG